MKFSRRLKRLRRRAPSVRDCWLITLGGLFVIGGGFIVEVMHHRSATTPLQPASSNTTIAWLPDTVKHWEPAIDRAAKAYDIDPNLLAIIMTMESGGYARAKSEAPALGLMQVTPPTGQDIARKFLSRPVQRYDLYNPTTSIEFGAAYLSYLRHEFGSPAQGPSWNDTVELIAAGYNGGPGAAQAVANGEGLRDSQTLNYSRDAYNMWRERHAARSPTYERWLARGGQRLIDQAKSNQQ